MILLFKILARLPLPILRLMGLILGWLMWAVSPRYRKMFSQFWALAAGSGRLSGSADQLSALKRQSIGHAGLLATGVIRVGPARCRW
jgi:hypothetical protein